MGGNLLGGLDQGRVGSLRADVAINAYARAVTDRIVVPIGRVMVRMGMTANALTLVGLLGTFVGLGIILSGRPVLGAATAGVAAVLDAFDGTVARLRGTQSQLGAFYDSVADRMSDTAVFATAAWIVRDDALAFAVVMVALGMASATSYIRAKAESLGWTATVGLVERTERLLLMLVALGLGFVEVAAWILAVGGTITVAQRLAAVIGQARQGSRA